MDWTQWGKGEERAQSSAGCQILEAPLIGKLWASVNVSWHNGAGFVLKNSTDISLFFSSAYVLILLLAAVLSLACVSCGDLHKSAICAYTVHVCRCFYTPAWLFKKFLNLLLTFYIIFFSVEYIISLINWKKKIFNAQFSPGRTNQVPSLNSVTQYPVNEAEWEEGIKKLSKIWCFGTSGLMSLLKTWSVF